MPAPSSPTVRVEVLEVGDRQAAVITAVELAGADDCVVVAGKGHEQGQEINGVVVAFDDRAVLRAAIAARTGAALETNTW